jgi:hypothetical protein
MTVNHDEAVAMRQEMETLRKTGVGFHQRSLQATAHTKMSPATAGDLT